MIAETDVQSPPNDQSTTLNPSENVDRIREILFGSRIREYAQRFLQMEERIARETAELKAEICRWIQLLEAQSRQELESLADRLNTERGERADAEERIRRELNDSVILLDRRLRQSEERGDKDIRELGQLALDRHKNLSDELRQSLAAAGTQHGRRLEELRAGAVDRLALADLFAEFSLRIRGEFRLPGEGNVTDAGADR